MDSIVSYFGKKAKAWIGRALSGPFRRAAEYFAIEVGQANDSAGPSASTSTLHRFYRQTSQSVMVISI